MPTALRPQWAMLTGDALLLGYMGDRRTLDYYRRAIPQSKPLEVVERRIEDDIAKRAGLWRCDGMLGFRAAVPPARVGELVGAIDGCNWVADAAFGVVLGSHIENARIALIKEAVAAVGGSVRFVENCDTTGLAPSTQQTQRLADLSTNPIERQIIERLKLAFDPDSKLNPLPWRIP